MYVCIIGWIDGQYVCVDGWMELIKVDDGWIDGWMDDRRMDKRVDEDEGWKS